MNDTMNDLFKNNIEFIAKQLQLFIDSIFPDADNNAEPMPHDPYVVTGQTSAYYGDYIYNHQQKSVTGLYNVQFCSGYNGEVCAFILGTGDRSDVAQYDAVLNNWKDSFSLKINENYLNDNIYQYNAQPYRPWSYEKNSAVLFDFTKNNVKITGQSYFVTGNGHTFNSYGNDYSPVYLHTSKSERPVVITDKTNAERYYTLYDKQGQYSVSDNIQTPSGHSVYIGGSAGGLSVGIDSNTNYDDIEYAFDTLFNDLSLNLSDGYEYPVVDFPDYYTVKYGDMGDFYIEPIHQYDPLPTAPTFDGTIDVKNYPLFVADSTTSFLELLPVSISAFLCAAVVISLLIGKIQH